MEISSRTPEGESNRCPICGHELRLEPARPPGDAPCPACGCLVWFPSHPQSPAAPSAHTEVFPELNGREDIEFNGRLLPDAGGDEIPLLRPVILVGRSETCDIVMRFANVSGKHCELAFRAGKWWIQDLGSHNGVKVNGRRIQIARLNPGDRISIARHKYSIDYALAAGPAIGP